jgi:hypothetical protein
MEDFLATARSGLAAAARVRWLNSSLDILRRGHGPDRTAPAKTTTIATTLTWLAQILLMGRHQRVRNTD